MFYMNFRAIAENTVKNMMEKLGKENETNDCE
nr:MAG TPA: hypothetical protein [Caudoviricetes sp.]